MGGENGKKKKQEEEDSNGIPQDGNKRKAVVISKTSKPAVNIARDATPTSREPAEKDQRGTSFPAKVRTIGPIGPVAAAVPGRGGAAHLGNTKCKPHAQVVRPGKSGSKQSNGANSEVAPIHRVAGGKHWQDAKLAEFPETILGSLWAILEEK